MTSKLSLFFPAWIMVVTLTESLAPATTHPCQSTPQPPSSAAQIYLQLFSYSPLQPSVKDRSHASHQRVISLKSQLGISALNPPGKQLSSLKRSLIPKILTDHKDQTQSSP